MKIDMHVHVADVESRASGATHPRQQGDSNARWVRRLSDWVAQSELDRVVLLALDAVHDADGVALPAKTCFSVSNDFVRQFCMADPAFMFGASIHPYRKDAVAELERVVAQGACLIKWIPSGQHIEPDSARCAPFYTALAHHGIPLLSHTGVEHTLGRRRSDLNHPRRLVRALEAGVTVIAAHCGVPLFLHEPSHFATWAALARQHPNLYGDLAAFAVVTRAAYVRQISRDVALRNKVAYGSDFPTMPPTHWCWQLGLRGMRRLGAIRNPLERNLQVMRALGMPEDAFETGTRILMRNSKGGPHG